MDVQKLFGVYGGVIVCSPRDKRFFANTCIFDMYTTILHVTCILGYCYCSWKDLFANNMDVVIMRSTICMENTEHSKNALNLLEFWGFQNRINRVRMPVVDFPRYSPR